MTHMICAMVKILLSTTSADEQSGHTSGRTTVVGGCKPIPFPGKFGFWVEVEAFA
jgi:hypothetical protein